MKSIDTIKTCFATMGYDSLQSSRKDLFKPKNMSCLSLIGIDIILTSIYIYYEANDFEEYVDAIYILWSLIFSFFTFAMLIWQVPKNYRFINYLENIITESKWT